MIADFDPIITFSYAKFFWFLKAFANKYIINVKRLLLFLLQVEGCSGFFTWLF